MTEREPRAAGLAIGPDPAAAATAAGAPIGSALPAQPTELVYESGLELQARSQWAFARRRFFRHRLAMASLVVLLTVFALGAFANLVAPYSYSDINIHLFTDSVKDVEMFLLNRQIRYRSRERRVYIGGEARSVPNFSVSTDDADFDITVFAPRDRRYQLRTTAEGKPFDRARIDWLDSVLESAGTAGAAANPL